MGNLVSSSADEPDNRRAPTSTAELPTERDNDAAPALVARPNQEREPAARHTEAAGRLVMEVKDEVLFQQDLDSLVSWTRQLCLKFNVEKCKIMRVAHSGQHQYDLAGVKLQEAHQEKDLGVKVSSTLKPSLRYTKAAAKAMQVLGIIKRNFVTQNKEDFRLLFDGYVRPHLEYCVQVWSPYLKKAWRRCSEEPPNSSKD